MATTDSNWDLIIKPKTGWLDIQISELWRYRDLIAMFVRRDFVTFYKQTILGPLWFIIQPLATSLVLVQRIQPKDNEVCLRWALLPQGPINSSRG